MKKIVFVGGGMSGGGQERGLSTFANYLAEKGYNVIIILLNKTEHFYKLNEKITFIEPTYSRDQLSKLSFTTKSFFYLRKEIKLVKPDVVLSWGEWFNSFVSFATFGLKINLFLFDKMGPDLNLGRIQNYARKIFYKHANGVFALTRYASDVIKKRTGAKNVFVVPILCNFQDVPELPKKKHIITVGRLSKEKGHKCLIDAFYKAKLSDWDLHIIGDGVERQNLTDLVSQYDLNDRVVFHGYKKDFKTDLSQSEIFVLPSLYEGFPNALLEAMSVPLACITSEYNPGYKDIISPGINGLTYPVGDSEALAESLKLLANDEILKNKIRDNAWKVRETFNFDEIAKRYINTIKENLK